MCVPFSGSSLRTGGRGSIGNAFTVSYSQTATAPETLRPYRLDKYERPDILHPRQMYRELKISA